MNNESSGRSPVGDGRMELNRVRPDRRGRMALVATLLLGALLLHPMPAGADSTGAGSGGGSVSVGASSGNGSGGSGGTGSGAPTGGSGSPGVSPWTCTYTYLTLNNQGGFANGGPTPGAWYSVTCVDMARGIQVTQTVWITGTQPTATPPVDPRALALQAESSMRLPGPTIHLNPWGTSLVGLDTWLWTDADTWHERAVTARAGAVSATAVAHPVAVEWTTGDGGQVTCHGPGTAYVFWVSAARQATTCSHRYLRTSAGQPTLDGNPDDGVFVVVATVVWAVSWTSTGIAGGGVLPTIRTTNAVLMRVAQVQSVNAVAASWPSGGLSSMGLSPGGLSSMGLSSMGARS